MRHDDNLLALCLALSITTSSIVMTITKITIITISRVVTPTVKPSGNGACGLGPAVGLSVVMAWTEVVCKVVLTGKTLGQLATGS